MWWPVCRDGTSGHCRCPRAHLARSMRKPAAVQRSREFRGRERGCCIRWRYMTMRRRRICWFVPAATHSGWRARDSGFRLRARRATEEIAGAGSGCLADSARPEESPRKPARTRDKGSFPRGVQSAVPAITTMARERARCIPQGVLATSKISNSAMPENTPSRFFRITNGKSRQPTL
jgi:hypothetical protein